MINFANFDILRIHVTKHFYTKLKTKKMKRFLLTFMAAIGIVASANAQLALENFNHGGALPTGWTMISDGHTVSTSFTTLTWLQDSLDVHAWFPVNAVATTTDYQMITTSKFTPAATPSRWLITPSFLVSSANTVIQWDDYDLGSKEPVTLLVSPTAGTTAGSFTTTIYHAPAATGALTTHQVPIGAYNGTTITIAFRDDTTSDWGLLVDNVQTTILPSLDLGVTSLNIPQFIQTGSSHPVTGILHNYGVTTTTSISLKYTVNGGAPVATALSGLSIPLGSNYTYTSGTPWVPATAGAYILKVWADNINGAGVDGNHANDTFTANITVLDSLQAKRVMIEEFTQASCDPCAQAHVNVDTVYTNNMSRSSLVRYHVNWPGRDCMDSVTLTPFVSARVTYYAVNGVPDAQIDGTYIYPGSGGLSTSAIGAAVSNGSPFKITVTSGYNTATYTYSVSATIKSYGAIAAGLKAYAVLVVDTLTYAANQSTETISQTIFPQVAEAMFPSSAGTTLAAFTTGATQTINSTWVKNHRWGSNYSVWSYDSTCTGKIIVWVEDDTKKYVYQAAEASVNTCSPVSVTAVTGSIGSMDIYPNPASNTATVSLNLITAANVKMEVYNMAGQLVYSMPAESRNAGTSVSTIDLSKFASGEYLIRVSIGNEVLNKKLTVTK